MLCLTCRARDEENVGGEETDATTTADTMFTEKFYGFVKNVGA